LEESPETLELLISDLTNFVQTQTKALKDLPTATLFSYYQTEYDKVRRKNVLVPKTAEKGERDFEYLRDVQMKKVRRNIDSARLRLGEAERDLLAWKPEKLQTARQVESEERKKKTSEQSAKYQERFDALAKKVTRRFELGMKKLRKAEKTKDKWDVGVAVKDLIEKLNSEDLHKMAKYSGRSLADIREEFAGEVLEHLGLSPDVAVTWQQMDEFLDKVLGVKFQNFHPRYPGYPHT